MSPTPAPTPTPIPAAPATGTLTPLAWADPQRKVLFEAWLADLQGAHQLVAASLRLASADASFRRYLRIDSPLAAPASSFVIMDAPPDKENCKPFVQVAQLMQQAGLKVPQVLDWDEANGFMLLTDLGAQTMMQVIQPDAAPPLPLYLEAVDTLIQWQLASQEGVLPPYDEALLMRELELFPHWYIGEHRQFTLDATQRKTLDSAFAAIVKNNLAWPSVYVHRDFMPRNLMISVEDAAQFAAGPPQGKLAPLGGNPVSTATSVGARLGVLDFQDAVYGPITYDIASLMRDAFLSWEEDFCLDVTIRYWQKARKAGLPVGDDFGEFYKGVEWMGLQRHLKVAGIFARLTLRDGKPQYLADTPRFIAYMRATCARYMELKPLLRLIERIEGIEVPNAYAFGRT
ncbi:MAG: phosphotransferase [Burkholderiales bacterium]|nr:phosphotransferase [Burkholderiales bacterium]